VLGFAQIHLSFAYAQSACAELVAVAASSAARLTTSVSPPVPLTFSVPASQVR